MTDSRKDLVVGDKVFFKGYADMYGDGCPLVRNEVGIIIGISTTANSQVKFSINFGEKGNWDIMFYDIDVFQDYESMTPIEKIQWEYSEWVDEYTDMLEKSHVTMNEVQHKYSRLALTWVIRELRTIGTEEATKRIEYLETLY